MPLDPLRVVADRFIDSSGRQVVLRGVNLGGDCKVPFPDGGTEHPSDFADHRDVSFIGRPFPMEEADEHLGRLKHWGFNLVRLLTTWEAVEHAGPGLYDAAYLDYYAEVCRRAGEHGLYVYVDFHEDVWSRMTGGDGAPGWTLEAAGLDLARFHDAGAAHVMQAKYDYARGGRQDSYPQMTWGMNHRLPAAAIMWSLFWGGRWSAPQFEVEGANIQDFLQDRYLGAMREVARRVKDLPNVIGFDTLNEPGVGWIGERLSYRHVGPSEDNMARARPGLALSALDALAAAQGLTVSAPMVTRDPRTAATSVTGEGVINPNGVSIWRHGMGCPFEAAGAYRIEGGRAVATNDEHFRTAEGRRLEISDDCYGPFFQKVAAVTRAINPQWAIFAELDAWGATAGRRFPRQLPERTVNASHWYDATMLYLKTFDPQNSPDMLGAPAARGPDEIRARYIRQLSAKAGLSSDFPGGSAPVLIGEFGIPYDLDEGAAYDAWAAGRRGDDVWAKHAKALELMYDALDELQLHSAQWNYTASNRNDLTIGDRWNQEDLSIYSRDQQDDPADPDSGGRAVTGFCRPYLRRCQGQLLHGRFDAESGVYAVRLNAEANFLQPTEIYVPQRHYPNGARITVTGAQARVSGPENQLVQVWAEASGALTIEVSPR
jgi:hypothetical protein